MPDELKTYVYIDITQSRSHIESEMIGFLLCYALSVSQMQWIYVWIYVCLN